MSEGEAPGALRGDLAHFFPSEILQLLQLAQATGRLELERAGEQAELFVERGRPVFARTTGAAVTVAEILLHRGAVTPEQLDRARAEQAAQPGRTPEALLVAAGAVAPGEVQLAVNEAVRRVIYGVLLWREGAFRFVPGEQIGAEQGRLDVDVDRLILEGLRQADEARAR